MKLFSLKSGFWIALLFALFVGSAFDFFALKQSAITRASGEAIVHSFQIINEVDHLLLYVHELHQSRDENNALKEKTNIDLVRGHYKKLMELAVEDRDILESIRFLSFLGDTTPDQAVLNRLEVNQVAALEKIRALRDTEENSLLEKVENDRTQSERARNQAIGASLLDILMLIFIGLLWMYDRRSRLQTESVLSETVKTLSKTNFDLEQVSRAKTHLLKATAHDLKNPLGSIKGFADLISEESTNPSVAEMSQIIQRISSQTLALVNLLSHPKALNDGKKLSQTTPVDLIACINDVCTSLAPQTLQKQQTIQCSHSTPSLEVTGDAHQLWDVFMNLIGNAVKFSPKASTIFIRSSEVDGRARVEIEDQGPGFTYEDKTKAFNKFQKLSAQPTGDETSSGLGLSLVKEVVESHNGQVAILDASTGRGACLVVELPLLHFTSERSATIMKDTQL